MTHTSKIPKLVAKFSPLLAGLVASQGFAQSYIWPALLGGMVYLGITLSKATTAREAFWRGYGFGFGLFLLSLAWITNALFVDIHKFWPLVIPSLLGFPLVLSCFTGLSGVATHVLRRHLPFPLAFALAWLLGEWLRGHLFTGLPWNLLGYGFMINDTLAQGAALVGVYGLSFFGAFLVGSLVFLRERRYGFMLLSLALLLTQTLYGYHRLSQADPTPTTTRLRLVQGNIAQKDKWDKEKFSRNVDHYLSLTTQEAPTPPQIIIWPEMALPFDISRQKVLQEHLSLAIPKDGYLLTGAPHFYEDAQTGEKKIGNSLTVLDDRGTIVAIYDKVHLVPFGEYIPFRDFLQKWVSINKITPGTMDFTPGPQLISLKLKGVPDVVPLVCYEAIFPGAVIPFNTPRPQWMLNITNDAWYGDTDGPRQHLDMVRMRAIEEGMPMVRAASTGISAVTDAYGRIVGKLDLNTTGVLDISLPKSIGPQGLIHFLNPYELARKA